MDIRTQRAIEKITYQTAMDCGMNLAIQEKPDEAQAHAMELAEYILKKTALSTGNKLTIAENENLAKKMQLIMDQKIKKITTIDEKRQIEYDKMLEYRIRRAIEDEIIPDPAKDPFIRRQMERLK